MPIACRARTSQMNANRSCHRIVLGKTVREAVYAIRPREATPRRENREVWVKMDGAGVASSISGLWLGVTLRRVDSMEWNDVGAFVG